MDKFEKTKSSRRWESIRVVAKIAKPGNRVKMSTTFGGFVLDRERKKNVTDVKQDYSKYRSR